jgi:acetyltransferase-like isoleucine patch superfamily enzyme
MIQDELGKPIPKRGLGTIFWESHLSNIHPTATFGADCRVHSHVWIGPFVHIGNKCKIQAFAFIPQGVRVGDGVFIGPHVCFVNDREPPSGGKGWEQTYVEDGVVIGANATIMCGLTLKRGCRIGAGSVVIKSVPPGETWVGNPARKLVKTSP